MAPTRRSFLTMATVAATVSTVAACSSSQKAAGAAASGGADQQASGSSGGDTNADLVIWADQKKADSLTEFAKKWGEQQGITVTVQTVANELQSNFITANQAGNGPDVVLGAHDWIGKLVQNNAIAPVVLSEKAQANYSDMALKAVTYNGQTYGAPYTVEALVLYVNKELTEKTSPATVEELVEAGKASGAQETLALPVGEEGDGYFMQPFYSSAGGYLFGT